VRWTGWLSAYETELFDVLPRPRMAKTITPTTATPASAIKK
jgi:hypothetical protein